MFVISLLRGASSSRPPRVERCAQRRTHPQAARSASLVAIPCQLRIVLPPSQTRGACICFPQASEKFESVPMVSLWRCVGLLIIGLASPLAAQPALDHKPYKPIEVTLPAAAADKSLEAFRKQLSAIAQRKDRAALARLVAKDFFWEGDLGGMFQAKKSGADNLAAALRLGDADARG